jgi:hypothetical protein
LISFAYHRNAAALGRVTLNPSPGGRTVPYRILGGNGGTGAASRPPPGTARGLRPASSRMPRLHPEEGSGPPRPKTRPRTPDGRRHSFLWGSIPGRSRPKRRPKPGRNDRVRPRPAKPDSGQLLGRVGCSPRKTRVETKILRPARRDPWGPGTKLPRPPAPKNSFSFRLRSREPCYLACGRNRRKHDVQVDCCRRLSRRRRNFGASDNTSADSSAGRHALASSLGVRPV